MTVGGFEADPRTFSFLIKGPGDPTIIPGIIIPENPRTIRFEIHNQLTQFRVGDHVVTLFGDVDPGGFRPAIADTAGSRLDGEPIALPSGNGTPGGNFRCRFTVQD